MHNQCYCQGNIGSPTVAWLKEEKTAASTNKENVISFAVVSQQIYIVQTGVWTVKNQTKTIVLYLW